MHRIAQRQTVVSDVLSPANVPLSAGAARELVRLLREVAGIRVDPANTQFISYRMDRRVTELGLQDYDAYLDLLRSAQGATEIQRLVESLATHTTSFFREKAHYDWLESTGLPELVAAGAGRSHPLTIWSAACSTGLELWSAGIVMDRFSHRVRGGLRWGLTGTDISAAIVQRAKLGIYTATELSGLPLEQRREYLLRSKPGARISPRHRIYRIIPALRARAQFCTANLLSALEDKVPQADVVFLRNVLIYFNADDRIRAIENAMRCMRSGAYLLLGHSDNLRSLPTGLRPCGTAVFRKD
jgi:chemotaxis protein methyltransferase CheR